MAAVLHSPGGISLLIGVCLPLAFYLIAKCRFRARSRGRPLPPGPPSLPFLGNLFDILENTPWKRYRELCQKYGDIIALQALGKTLVVIDNHEIAVDMMEKHSATFSSRPRSSVLPLLGVDWHFGMLPYGKEWRQCRRIFLAHFHPSEVVKYAGFREKGALDLLARLLSGSGKLEEDLRYTVGSSMIQAIYGLEVAPINDEIMMVFEEGVQCLDLLLSGSSILEFLPILGKIPTWIPGTYLQRRLSHYRKVIRTLRDMPWDRATKAISNGQAPDCVARKMVESLSHGLDKQAASVEDTTFKSVAASTYTAGLDTQDSSLASFFLAMSLHPQAQKKAQEELEAVVGLGRLPNLQDRDSLPYINALIKETMRWHTVAPLGVAHSSSADARYDGYFIPKDTIIMINSWSILHNPETYPEPDRFMPERFLKDGRLDPSVQDPAKIAFGYGRRVCPGRDFAEGTLFLHIAYVLHTFDITPPLDEHGEPIRITPQATTGLISHISDCRCTVKLRSAKFAERLIRDRLSEETP